MGIPFRTPVVLSSELSPEQVVRRLLEHTGSRYGFTALHLYDRGIEGRVRGDEFWMERRRYLRGSSSRRLWLRVVPDGIGSRLVGHFSVTTETIAATSIWIVIVLSYFYRDWRKGALGAELFVLPFFLFMVPIIVFLQLRRSLRDEPMLLKFVEDTLNGRVIPSNH